MSNNQILVMFDKEDRTYQFGEEVSGTVVLDTQAKLTCQKIWIDYGWRTHGMGDVDKGGGETLILLSEEVQFQSGEHREYPFRFRAPNGPVTYHGHFLNVEWYVTAQMTRPFHQNIKSDQDFLLIPCRQQDGTSPGNSPAISRGISPYTKDLMMKVPVDRDVQYSDPPGAPFSLLIFGVLAILLMSIILISQFLGYSASQRFYAAGIVLGLFIVNGIYSTAYPAIVFRNWRRSFEIGDLQISTLQLHTGDRIFCRIQLQANGTLYLDNITATLSSVEVCVGTDGSSAVTNTHVAYKETLDLLRKSVNS